MLRRLPPGPRRVALRRLLESAASRQRRLDAAFAEPVGRLIFVCHGNIMRSAFAVAYLRKQAPEMAERIIGAGTHATAGREAQESAIRVAPQFGVELVSHRAAPFSALDPMRNDVVVCMDRANEANVLANMPGLDRRVFLVGDVAASGGGGREVADPYNKGDVATGREFTLVAKFAEIWLTRIRNPGPPLALRLSEGVRATKQKGEPKES